LNCVAFRDGILYLDKAAWSPVTKARLYLQQSGRQFDIVVQGVLKK
jgi:hypothetical protein